MKKQGYVTLVVLQFRKSFFCVFVCERERKKQ